MCIIDNITKIASSKGISQAFICEKLGKRRNYLFNLKTQNKNPSDDQMGIIANVLNVTVEELTGRTDDPTSEKEKSPSFSDGLANDEALIVQLYRGAKSLDDKKDIIRYMLKHIQPELYAEIVVDALAALNTNSAQ